MNLDILFAPHAGKTLRTGLVGAGEFGASFLFRSGRAPGLKVVAVADREPTRAIRAAERAGIPGAQIRVCATRAQALDAQAGGAFVVVEDLDLLAQLDLEFVVEATGTPEAAARTALAAIANGKNIAMVTKEADCVAGPELQARASAAGLLYTPVDGDQPSLIVALASWARLLGLEIVCAGKSGEYDFVFDPVAATITTTETGHSTPAPAFSGLWRVPPAELVACVAERARQLPGLRAATVPDLCELTIVANATGLRPDRPQLHAPIARTLELPDLFRPRASGGLLGGEGRLDMFACLRRPDELSFAGGVFVVVRCDDQATWGVLRDKGIPVSDDLGVGLIHNPVHLLGMEAPVSLFNAAFLRAPAAALNPVCDLVGRSTRRLPRGTRFEIGARHTIDGVAPEIVSAQPVAADHALPYYMLAGCTLREDLAAGQPIARGLIDAPADSTLWELRAAQDARFTRRA